jgi:hypothetical protein
MRCEIEKINSSFYLCGLGIVSFQNAFQNI